MDIFFQDDDLERLCSEERYQKRKLGAICAKKLKRRLNELRVSDQLSDLVAGNPHPLKGNYEGCYAVDLHGGYRLVFRPADDPLPETEAGEFDWGAVTSVCVVFIGDYHD